MKNKKQGFTLIELMIVIAIIGILAAVGYPAYTSSVQKANRADAIDALVTLSQQLEKYYLVNESYTDATVTGLMCGTTSDNGKYTLTMTGADGSGTPNNFGYKLTATPVTTDSFCGNLTLDSIGTKGTSAGTVAACW
ncbi:MAG: prepilin-type N-terminal cleavage/methylation domain-containing protein [Gammaproteobacteria bacterium]|nr:prepilin-type N-terminal cleavage/methylation domain-containing protein [Gammaproteobacteria bacterium]